MAKEVMVRVTDRKNGGYAQFYETEGSDPEVIKALTAPTFSGDVEVVKDKALKAARENGVPYVEVDASHYRSVSEKRGKQKK